MVADAHKLTKEELKRQLFLRNGDAHIGPQSPSRPPPNNRRRPYRSSHAPRYAPSGFPKSTEDNLREKRSCAGPQHLCEIGENSPTDAIIAATHPTNPAAHIPQTDDATPKRRNNRNTYRRNDYDYNYRSTGRSQHTSYRNSRGRGGYRGRGRSRRPTAADRTS